VNSRGDDVFGVLLHRLRSTRNLTQEQLAERSGLSVHAVSMLERGARRAPRGSTVELLAAGLRLDEDERRRLWAAARSARSAAPPNGHWHAAQPPQPGIGLPPAPVPLFVGRESELRALHERLLAAGRAAVVGLAGIGKTQLAARYACEWRQEYPDGLFWLRGDQESTLVGDLASLTWRLGLPEREASEHERQVDAVLRWFRAHPRWLVVVDDLEIPVQEACARWLPANLPGRVLVTTRTPVGTARLHLRPLAPELATRFLLERTGRPDRAAARSVVEALGRLPLALEQAAAYLTATGRDLTSYSELLQTRLMELMAEGQPQGYPRPLASALRLSVQKLAEERPASVDLLRLCAFLEPNDIPLELVQASANQLGETLQGLTDALELDRAICALHRYSLAERRGDSLQVHRLVQATVRRSLGARQQRAWTAAAVRLLHAGFPEQPQDRARWRVCARLLPHVHAVSGFAASGPVEAAVLGSVLDRAGAYLRARTDYEAALEFCESALAVRERSVGEGHPDTAVALHQLGHLRMERGQLDLAKALHERALGIRERVLGGDHPRSAETLNSLAWVVRGQGDPAKAEALVRRAISILERRSGAGDPRTAGAISVLGAILRDQGKFREARSALERALAIFDAVPGAPHPDTGRALLHLAALLQAEGDLAAARPLLERALAVQERAMGPLHLHTAWALCDLARVLGAQGELPRALDLGRRATTIFERLMGYEHPWTAGSRALEQALAAAGPAAGFRERAPSPVA
jgi:tetratricopeptide (TPR) repeat protein/transcriptional regulator with XRE-family HTH domain